MIIRHQNGQYPVDFGDLRDLLVGVPDDARVITDENVRAAVSPWPMDRPTLVLPPGEETKSMGPYQAAISWLAQERTSRRTAVVAVGGGVIGDLVGFVAASYMRGVPFIQVPTTLLAMVDSSVGGKVGLDLPEGKNLVGAFYPPQAVYIDPTVLRTLPVRQFRNGMAEVWKYGFIMCPELLDQLAADALHPEHPSLEAVIQRCINLKAQVVEEDEFETNGRRAILNFGHTIGHAIEKLTGYGPVLHGEAISIGMVLEGRLGYRLGLTAESLASEVETSLKAAGLPTSMAEVGDLDPDGLVQAMRLDKKASAGRLAFSLLTGRGECKLTEDVSEADVRAVLTI